MKEAADNIEEVFDEINNDHDETSQSEMVEQFTYLKKKLFGAEIELFEAKLRNTSAEMQSSMTEVFNKRSAEFASQIRASDLMVQTCEETYQKLEEKFNKFVGLVQHALNKVGTKLERTEETYGLMAQSLTQLQTVSVKKDYLSDMDRANNHNSVSLIDFGFKSAEIDVLDSKLDSYGNRKQSLNQRRLRPMDAPDIAYSNIDVKTLKLNQQHLGVPLKAASVKNKR